MGEELKVLELFAGIGACSKALTNLGVAHKIVDAVEVDKFAVKSFNAVHGTNFEPQDIKEWDKDVEADLIMHGSPCQDFSVAGKGKGGDEGSGTRSSLLYETLRIVEKLKPKYVIWENVKALISEKHRHNFDKYQERMTSLGYTNYYQVLNAKDYGVPQNRERVFTVSIRDDLGQDFTFPSPVPLTKVLKDVLDPEVEDKYYLSDEKVQHMQETNWALDKLDNVKSENEVGRTIRATNYKNPQCVRVGGLYDIVPPLRVRKLTPKECWRLMGFDDEDFAKAQTVNSNCQLYKQAGNSIVVNVLTHILGQLVQPR